MSRSFKTVIAHAIELAEIRLSQWQTVADGNSPIDCIDELYQAGHNDGEADSMVNICRELIDDLTALKPEPENSQHWIISVQDSINDYREVQTGYFDGTQADAITDFLARPRIASFAGNLRYQISITANPVIIQWPSS